MKFRQYFEMTDKWTQSEQAHAAAKQMIASAGGGRFHDLVDFRIMVYTDEELDDLGEPQNRNWVGQYVAGSIDGPHGATVLLQLDRHESLIDMMDTLLHEMGHALWELLDDRSHATWQKNQTSHQWGAEEAFADDFMHLCRGETMEMNNEELFDQITQTGPQEDGPQPTQHQSPSDDLS